jgi:DNA-directed RNA polymerase specialized sigma24 family protein
MPDGPEHTDLDHDLTLKLWGGDDTAKAELLHAWGVVVEKAIRKAYPALKGDDPEDVVAEGIQRFWLWRDKYDPNVASIMTMLYMFAEQVAIERRTGKLNWQRQQIRERGVDADFFERVKARPELPEPPDDAGPKQSPFQRQLAECFSKLPALQQDILQAYGDAGHYPLDATALGIELGKKYKDGSPIPGGTIRGYKSRAWETLDLCMKKKNFDLEAMGYFDE